MLWIGIILCGLEWDGRFPQYFIGQFRGLNMADKRITMYPPNGKEPVIANPEYRQQYLDMGWTEEKPKETPKPDGKTTGKTKRAYQ